MCRWGCTTTDTTYMCKWCGTRYCRDCLRGDFDGYMRESTICRKCFQPRCQGVRVEYVLGRAKSNDSKDQKGKRGQSARSRSASSRGRSANAKRGKSAGRKRSGKALTKKRKR